MWALDASDGSQVWVDDFDSGGNLYGSGMEVTVSPDNSKVFIAGSWYNGAGAMAEDQLVAAYDTASGNQLWVKFVDGGSSQSDSTKSIRVSPDSTRVYVGGYVNTGSGAFLRSAAYDSVTGNEVWATTYTGGGSTNFYASQMALSPDGDYVYLVGTNQCCSNYNMIVVAHDAATGAEAWATQYDGPGSSSDQGRSIDVSADGARLFITGNSVGSSGRYEFGTVALAT